MVEAGARSSLSKLRNDGFAMPPDWAPHARCWMAWPCRAESWGGGLDAARQAFAEVAQAIAVSEPVTMIARPDLVASASLYCGPGITVLPLDHDDSWSRDVGPSFLLGPAGAGLGGVAWQFNGWGGLHAEHERDQRLAGRLLDHVGARRFEGGMVLEGGAFQVDGDGTLFAGASTILDARRNPGLKREAAEAILLDRLGAEKVIWLPHGLVEDEAGGHLENVLLVAAPGRVLALSTDDGSDANHGRLAENLEILRAATDARGRRLEVIPVPQPRARKRHDGTRLTLSHLSCYLTAENLIMPGFGDATDAASGRLLAQAFPGRGLVEIDALDIVEGGGGIRSITLPQPALPAS